MSRSGRAETADLRRLIARIEAGTAPAIGERAKGRINLARGLDHALGGGLADDALHEIVPAAPADGPAAGGFALALAARFLAARPSAALLIGEGFAAEEFGAPYGPGLVAHGLPLGRLVFVRAPDAGAALWAMEEALKSGAPAAVVGELLSLKPYNLAASRRLLLAARKGRIPALLVLTGAHGRADRLSSAAATRFEIAAAPSARMSAASGKALPGPFACTARLVKARLALPCEGATEAVDSGRIHRLEWRCEERTFDDPALPLALAAASGDRPRAARVGAVTEPAEIWVTNHIAAG